MKTRPFRIMLLVLLAAGSVLTTAPPAWAQEECDPGGNCTGFDRGDYVVVETSGYVELRVSAAFCCPPAQGQVDYRTFNLSAFASQDYEQTSGTLTFAGGGYGSIQVPITEDDLSEDEERFEVRLTSFRGTFTRRGRETAIVRIIDYSRGSTGTQSNEPTEGSQVGSSANTPLPPSTASTGSTAAGNQSEEASPANPTLRDGASTEDGAERVAAETERHSNGTSPVRNAGLRALLLVMVVAAGFGVKKSLDARKST